MKLNNHRIRRNHTCSPISEHFCREPGRFQSWLSLFPASSKDRKAIPLLNHVIWRELVSLCTLLTWLWHASSSLSLTGRWRWRRRVCCDTCQSDVRRRCLTSYQLAWACLQESVYAEWARHACSFGIPISRRSCWFLVDISVWVSQSQGSSSPSFHYRGGPPRNSSMQLNESRAIHGHLLP